jgi:hypothetical protein
VKGSWGTLHKEDLRDLYSSSRLIRINKSMKMRWEENVAQNERRG